ncbi:GNAT family N-acetyltransferase [Arthrobacter psychrochitiniphilus]|uniref:Uncharacterized protein n=1 Tax=Arthrobacter psychrochitiniphilus TaxID=291045 RepID=A0A2V3DUI1_9MICC|nr:GNAT family N-acetyltransferase [Arthrobacter psychrochitiniphilus]NYG15701.1 GNAT superfamily N-acetyltransferase [Arthrobacter psychrochitiniphilus]PXA66832.1 hypothetical protein CVS29_04500 [Arthrobacter psychrochitiniphilus]
MIVASTGLADQSAAWFAGWTALRSYPSRSGTGYLAALRLDRNSGWEYFTTNPTPSSFASLAQEVNASSQRALCVLGSDVHKYVKMAHQSGMGMLSASEQLMVCHLENQDNQDPFLGDPELSLVIKAMGGKHSSSVCEERFSVAIVRGQTVLAAGKVGIYGEYAIFDQIETHSQHRRRGYGMLLMKAMTARAQAHPVTTGLLLASTDGQRLYFKLGWRAISPVTVLVPKSRIEELTRTH